MSGDYGYINARVRAMKSFLLKKEDYLEALRQNSADEFMSFLLRLPDYANDMRQAMTAQSSRFVLEEAIKLNLCRTYRKIIRFCEGEAKELIVILVRIWDIYNLKTIIRGILNYQAKNEIIQALIPAGKWDLEFLKQLAESKDLKSLTSVLGADAEDDYEKEIAQLIGKYAPDSPLEILENHLTEIYFKEAYDSLKEGNNNRRIILDYFSLQIDFLNIILILKKTKTKLIKGGRLAPNFLKGLTELKSQEDILKAFAQSYYPWLSSEGLNLYQRNSRLSSLERLFRNKLFVFCQNLYMRGDPLSMSIPLAFINFKENEVRNLRLLSKTISFGIPYDLIKEELIFAS